MGNEKSALGGLEIDEKAVEITDFWLHHSASVNGSTPQQLSVFISEPSLHSTASFGNPSPLERTAKNLMLYRHPCILKYISSWHKGSKFLLATEEVKPLVQAIGTQTTLQICIGLHSILRALIFLHEKALASHNNVCSSSIYVTSEGFWKLGGLEYLCRFTELTPAYLQKTRNYRYEKAISPEEDGAKSAVLLEPTAIDQFAFGVLAEEVLRLKNNDDVPALAEFKELCKRHLQNVEPSLRTKLSSVLIHPFFTHDFITIHAFLMELPLKSELDKQEFFSNLVVQLKGFPEKIVAEQLGKLLLSRMVLLDFTAQEKLLPHVLKPKGENGDERDSSLFSLPTFKSHLVPRLLQIFCVRDASIRLLLLSHFNSFSHAFQTEELKTHILPELLVGIKDTNDLLVSTTLRALADLVPILGAAAVIGGSRGKVFTDGRPNKIPKRKESRSQVQRALGNIEVKNVPTNTNTLILDLPERPSPDGGEDGIESKSIFAEEESTWSDWETQEVSNTDINTSELALENTEIVEELQLQVNVQASENSISLSKTDKQNYTKKLIISDISELDIKHSKSVQPMKDEFDFFTDMEPVIQKTQVLHIEDVSITKNLFDMKTFNGTGEADVDDEGWGDDLNDWGAEETNELKD
ncbi:protein-associating with the carboxyl-terminal domain of ezrin [Cephus cinctus]|uniref:Protein-associating with the carboxyl-terminal domain of ezrin n=1 Tax=Cephus cinctus TaxID=211228 RepID=A0AAJ7BV83_CEPCN|nr:protein-associating with the carboxyl-terminal domain of ezrin [Cephus cinctus]